MPVDPSVLSQLDTAHARGVAASAGLFEQHAAMITIAAQHDSRLMNGFLAQQLFAQGLMEEKAAYHTPVEPGAAALATPPSK